MRDNPDMKKSTAFAVATQQSHATGHTPKGYGTAEGKREAKAKYDKPKSDYKQTADPSHKSKSSSVDMALLMGFSDELEKIALGPTPPTTLPRVVSATPKTPAPMTRRNHFSQPSTSAPAQVPHVQNALQPLPATAAPHF